MNDAKSGDKTVQPIYSEDLGRYVTVRSCECSAASRHTVLGPETVECDHCGEVKLGVSVRYDVPETDRQEVPA